MFYEGIRTKQDLSYISICSLSILYNSKFILMTMSLGTNAVPIMRVHCTSADREGVRGTRSAQLHIDSRAQFRYRFTLKYSTTSLTFFLILLKLQ